MIRGKRGDFAASELGDWSIWIIGFVIILITAGSIYVLISQSDEDQLCKLSVLSRATASLSGVEQAIPLKCTTKKVCFTSGAGNCKEQFAGEKNVEIVKIPQINEKDDAENMRKAAEIIEEKSAEKMYNCWELMGEGKLDLFNNFGTELGLSKVQTTCVICSRLAIDKSSISDDILDEMGKKYIDINGYLATAKVSSQSDMTYLQAFLDSKDVQGYAVVNQNIFNSKQSLDNLYNNEVKTDEFARQSNAIAQISSTPNAPVNREMTFVFMQIKSVPVGSVLSKQAAIGATVAGTIFATPIVRNIASRLIFTPAGGIIAGGATLTIGGYGAYNAYQGQLTSINYCGKFTTNEKSQEGCSLVQGLNYNEKEMNALCGSFQGRLYDVE